MQNRSLTGNVTECKIILAILVRRMTPILGVPSKRISLARNPASQPRRQNLKLHRHLQLKKLCRLSPPNPLAPLLQVPAVLLALKTTSRTRTTKISRKSKARKKKKTTTRSPTRKKWPRRLLPGKNRIPTGTHWRIGTGTRLNRLAVPKAAQVVVVVGRQGVRKVSARRDLHRRATGEAVVLIADVAVTVERVAEILVPDVANVRNVVAERNNAGKHPPLGRRHHHHLLLSSNSAHTVLLLPPPHDPHPRMNGTISAPA